MKVAKQNKGWRGQEHRMTQVYGKKDCRRLTTWWCPHPPHTPTSHHQLHAGPTHADDVSLSLFPMSTLADISKSLSLPPLKIEIKNWIDFFFNLEK